MTREKFVKETLRSLEEDGGWISQGSYNRSDRAILKHRKNKISVQQQTSAADEEFICFSPGGIKLATIPAGKVRDALKRAGERRELCQQRATEHAAQIFLTEFPGY